MNPLRPVTRWLHPWRRSRAQARVRAHPGPAALLVLCHGNICRSPFAAAVLARALPPAVRSVGSAGFIGPGRPVPPRAVEAARHYGVDLTAHRSRLLTPALLDSADLVVVMDDGQRSRLRREFGWHDRDLVLLGDLDPSAIPDRAILDPYDRSLAEYLEVYARIERCVVALGRSLAPPGPRAAAAGPVAGAPQVTALPEARGLR